MPPKLVRVEILAQNPEVAAAAWRHASGLLPVAKEGSDADVRLAAGGVTLDLLASGGDRREGLQRITLEVDDLDAAIGRLSKFGARIAASDGSFEGRRCVRLDPESAFGVPVLLVQAPGKDALSD